jgi:hypothetical protein
MSMHIHSGRIINLRVHLENQMIPTVEFRFRETQGFSPTLEGSWAASDSLCPAYSNLNLGTAMFQRQALGLMARSTRLGGIRVTPVRQLHTLPAADHLPTLPLHPLTLCVMRFCFRFLPTPVGFGDEETGSLVCVTSFFPLFSVREASPPFVILAFLHGPTTWFLMPP